MDRGESLDGFEFDHDHFFHQEIEPVPALQPDFFVYDR